MTGARTGTTLGYYERIYLAWVKVDKYSLAELLDVGFREGFALEKVLDLLVETANINVFHKNMTELL